MRLTRLSLNAGLMGNWDSVKDGANRRWMEGRAGRSPGCGLFSETEGMVLDSGVLRAGLMGNIDSDRDGVRRR
jgi:hypothetical protein